MPIVPWLPEGSVIVGILPTLFKEPETFGRDPVCGSSKPKEEGSGKFSWIDPVRLGLSGDIA